MCPARPRLPPAHPAHRGFIDTHCHPSGVNELYGVNTNLRRVADVQAALRRKAPAHRSFLDHGIAVPGASDYPPGPFEPLMGLQSMVTHQDYKAREWGANQEVSVDEALRIGTLNAARASSKEGLKGSIAAGRLADFVLLEKGPHDADPHAIKDIGIVRTVVGGRTMHPKGAA